MFSGGTDSTLAAALMLEEGRDVHLLCYNPGFVLFLRNSRFNASRLIQVTWASKTSAVFVEGPFMVIDGPGAMTVESDAGISKKVLFPNLRRLPAAFGLSVQ